MRVLAVVAVAFVLFFVGLDAYDLDTKGEPREGFTAWEMIHSGEWTLPHLNGETLPEKPLVFPWLVAASTLALGEGGELAPRLPSALMGLGLILVVYALGKRLQGEGVRAAVICATTALVVSLARRARVDMTLSFFVSLALLQFLRALERPSWQRIGLFWVSVSLATLTKGPIGLILPGLVIATFLFIEGRLDMAPVLARGLPLYLVLAGSWYVNGLLREGRAFAYQSFLMENVLMYVGSEQGGGHEHGTLYYFKYIPMVTFPWCLYLPAALWAAWQRRRERRAAFPLAWLASLFVFFSIGRGKRADYLLPLMPALALLVADLWRGRADVLRAASAVGAAITLAALAAFAVPWVRAQIPVALDPILLVAGAVTGIAPALLLAAGRRSAALASMTGGITLLALGVVFKVMPEQQRTRPFVEQVAHTVGTAPLVEYDLLDYTTVYYLRRRIPTVASVAAVASTLDAGGYALVSNRAFSKLPPELRGRIAVVAADRLLLGQRPK